MAHETISSIVSQLEAVTSDVKQVQAKLQAFQAALRDFREFGTTFQQAVARQDMDWLLKTQEKFDHALKHLQNAANEFEAVLK